MAQTSQHQTHRRTHKHWTKKEGLTRITNVYPYGEVDGSKHCSEVCHWKWYPVLWEEMFHMVPRAPQHWETKNTGGFIHNDKRVKNYLSYLSINLHCIWNICNCETQMYFYRQIILINYMMYILIMFLPANNK